MVQDAGLEGARTTRRCEMGSDGVDACHDASATPRDEDQLSSGASVDRSDSSRRALARPVGVFRRRSGEDRRGRRIRRRLRSSEGGSSATAVLRYVSDLDRRIRGASSAARRLMTRRKRGAAASADDATQAARLVT